MRTAAQLVFALLFIGTVLAYVDGGWPAVNKFWKLKVAGE